MNAFEIGVVGRMADSLQAELLNWAVGGCTLMVIALAVVGCCAVIKAVAAGESCDG